MPSIGYADLPQGHHIPRKKQYRDDKGEVIIMPPNFLTMPMKTGRVQRRDPVEFGGAMKYAEDEYDAGKKVGKAETRRHSQILQKMQDGRPFYGRGMPQKLVSFAETGVFNPSS